MVALQCLQTMVKSALIIVKNLFCCNDDGYFPIVETTILSLCIRMSLLTQCVLLRATRRVAHVKEDLLTFTENLWSNVLMGLIKVARSLVFYLHIDSCLFFHRFFCHDNVNLFSTYPFKYSLNLCSSRHRKKLLLKKESNKLFYCKVKFCGRHNGLLVSKLIFV